MIDKIDYRFFDESYDIKNYSKDIIYRIFEKNAKINDSFNHVQINQLHQRIKNEHTTFMSALEITEIWSEKYKLDDNIISTLLNKYCSNEEWQYKKNLFHSLPKNIQCIYLTNNYMKQALKHHAYHEVEKVFKKSLDSDNESDRPNVYTCTIYIEYCSKVGSFNEATEVFKYAKKVNIVDTVLCNVYINACIRNGILSLAKEAFLESVECKKFDPYIFNSIMKACGDGKDWDFVYYVLKLSKEFFIDSDEIYALFIEACIKNNKWNEALIEFFHARKIKKANVFSYTAFIKLCANNDEFDLAKMFFEEAVLRNYVDEIFFNCYLKACLDNRKWDAAQIAYRKSKELNKDDFITCNTYIDILFQQNNIDAALSLFEKSHIHVQYKKTRNDQGPFAYDLHGLSHGAGVMFCLDFILKNPNVSKFAVITGRGSSESGNYLAFSDVLRKYLNKAKDITCYRDVHNEGVLIIEQNIDWNKD